MAIQEAPSARLTGSDLAEKAIGSAIEAWSKMTPLVLSATLASVFLSAIFSLVQVRFGISVRDATWAGTLLAIIRTPFDAAIQAPLAVAMHRLILLGETTRGIISLKSRYSWRFFLWLYVIVLISTLLSWPFLAQNVAIKTVGAVLVVGIFVFCTRSALVFPAIAIEVPDSGWQDRLRVSWRQMDGQFWVFVRGMLLAFLALLLALVFPVVLVVTLANLIVGLPRAVVHDIMAGLLRPAAIMVFAAIASWMYAWVRDIRQT
jgi:hypothetical protein